MSSQYPWGATLSQCWRHSISPMTPVVTLTKLPCHVEPSWCIIWNMKLHRCSISNNRRSQCRTMCALNTLRPRQNGHWFTENIFKCIFLNENVRISIQFSQKFVPMGQVNNITSLVQITAWCWPGYKPLYETMIVSLLMHICITHPQYVYILYHISECFSSFSDLLRRIDNIQFAGGHCSSLMV